MSDFPPCVRPGCGHTAWCHGDQSGHPTAQDPCHAAGEFGNRHDCPCDGYVDPQHVSAAPLSGTAYPPDGVSSLSGDARGSQSASGSDGTTAGSPAERLRRAAAEIDEDGPGALDDAAADALAAWLRATADRADRLAFGHLACDEPLALADAILRGEDQ